MYHKTYSFARVMGCFSCFGFTWKPKRKTWSISRRNHNLSRELLLDEEIEDEDEGSYSGEITDTAYGEDNELPICVNRSEEILRFREHDGMRCRQFPVKETQKLIRSEDEDGKKMVNEYVHVLKIGAGSYAKVVLYQSSIDGKRYAIKAFHKSHLLKVHVAPSETAMSDVLREVQIMKMLEHPNIVNLIEVIDDTSTDQFYMVLEYVDRKLVEEGSVTPGIGENTARKYLRDIVSGLMYLHDHNIVHGDIKPDNLLVTHSGDVKIGDFSVSQVFENGNDELCRSPGTPVFTAPECCLGLPYHGKAADTWAVGVTLYFVILGDYPFLGDTLQETYDKIVNKPLVLPDDLSPQLKGLLEGLLCKDPKQRMALDSVATYSWVIGEDGPIPQYLCWCRRSRLQMEQSKGTKSETNITIAESDETTC